MVRMGALAVSCKRQAITIAIVDKLQRQPNSEDVVGY